MLSQMQQLHNKIHCYSKDKKGAYLSINSAVAGYLQIENIKDVLGKTDKDFPEHEPYASIWIETHVRIINTRESEILLESAAYNGGLQWFRSFKSPMLGKNKRVIGVSSVSIPIQAKSLIPLTRQQIACLKHLAMGLTHKQIALALGLSPKTVEHYLDTVKVKLNCQSRSELILQAIERGLVNFL